MKMTFLTALLISAVMIFADAKYITELSDSNFDKEVLQSQEIVMVDFWAPWCGPCKTLGPIIDELSSEYHTQMKFTKLNVDNNRNTSAKFGIRSIPTVGIFIGGEPVDGFVGLRSKDQIKEIIERHLKNSGKPESSEKAEKE